MPKCFQLSGITKTLFPCKSTPPSNQDNYVIFSHENKSDVSLDCSTINPATSTMIDSMQFSSSTNTNGAQSMNRFHISDITNHRQNDYYILQSDSDNYHRQFMRNDTYTELEETRRSSIISSSSIRTYNTNDDFTIVQHNNSPISDHRNTIHNQSDESAYNGFDCLQSTKISNDNYTSNSYKKCELPTSLSPLSSYKQSTLMHSPVSASTSISAQSDYQDSQIGDISSQLHSIISGLSSILEDPNDNETHACVSNYEATFVDDVTVQFADTVRIIRDNNDDWLYVQVSSDGRMGYVPKSVVLGLKEFVDQLKDQQSQMPSMEFPIRV